MDTFNISKEEKAAAILGIMSVSVRKLYAKMIQVDRKIEEGYTLKAADRDADLWIECGQKLYECVKPALIALDDSDYPEIGMRVGTIRDRSLRVKVLPSYRTFPLIKDWQYQVCGEMEVFMPVSSALEELFNG